MPIHPANAYEGERCIICYGCGGDWTGESVRRAYESSILCFNDAGIAPNRLSYSGKWGSFQHNRHHLERTDFNDLRFLSLSHRIEGEEPSERALGYLSLHPEWNSFEVSWLPSLIGERAEILDDLFKTIAVVSFIQYGTQYSQRIAVPSKFYMPPNGSLEHQWMSSASYWMPHKPEQADSFLLRDIYPKNFLNQRYLDAPVGLTGLSLREWINKNPAERGSLMPFTKWLTEWTPPTEKIPWIREALFRGGRIFYHRFFRQLDYDRVVVRGESVPRDDLWKKNIHVEGPLLYPPDPYYRSNVHEPWEATDPIPAIFQASRYDELFSNRADQTKSDSSTS